MYDYYFTFRSITGAQRGEQLLMKRSVPCKLLRSPKFLSIKGCGYALKIRSAQFLTAANILRLYGAPVQKIYRVGADGQGEEVVL